jgi:hypothetical protein
VRALVLFPETSPPRLHFPQLNWEDSTTCQTWVYIGRYEYGPPVYRKKKTSLFQYEDVYADHSVVQEDTPPMKVFIGQHIHNNGKDGPSQSIPISYGAMTRNIPSLRNSNPYNDVRLDLPMLWATPHARQGGVLRRTKETSQYGSKPS